jgi:hypothetical protein
MRSGSVIDESGKQNMFAVEPEMYVDENSQTGFTVYAEKVNGQAAMIGFASLLLIEIFTKHSFISLLIGG